MTDQCSWREQYLEAASVIPITAMSAITRDDGDSSGTLGWVPSICFS